MTPEQIIKDMKKRFLQLQNTSDLMFRINAARFRSAAIDYVKKVWNNPSLAKKLKNVNSRGETMKLLASEIKRLEKDRRRK